MNLIKVLMIKLELEKMIHMLKKIILDLGS
ncbi:Uncharacterised protein [Salmonella enterica subsp. enterica serovar Typhimurium str. DT104]|nr:Uncharacterised protein [Salmonella enterica subsp. enterica serovar Typhimurium str. DT104]